MGIFCWCSKAFLRNQLAKARLIATSFGLSLAQLSHAGSCVVDARIVQEPRLEQAPEHPGLDPGTPLLYHCNTNCHHCLKQVRLLLVPRWSVPVPVVLPISFAYVSVLGANVVCIVLECEIGCVVFADIRPLEAPDQFHLPLDTLPVIHKAGNGCKCRKKIFNHDDYIN